jgi:RNA polymerase sigma-70 factor, ECF subfamily
METTAARIEMAEAAPQAAERSASPSGVLSARFEQLYAVVYRYLVHRLFDRELAEELTAETFYRAVGSVGRLRADERHIQMWLLRIATNLANQHYRRVRLRRILLGRFASARGETGGGDPAPDADDHRASRVRAVLRALPSKYQTVLVLRYYERMSFEEIAAILRCREATVRSRLSRAVRQVRERLGLPDAPKT